MVFAIITRSGNYSGRKMSIGERQDLQGKLAEQKGQLLDDGYSHLRQNKSSIAVNVQKMQDTIDKDDSLVAKGKEKDKIRSRIRSIDHILKKFVPPEKMQRTDSKSPDFEKSIQASMRAMDPKVVDLCNERASLQRRVDPDNPDSGFKQ